MTVREQEHLRAEYGTCKRCDQRAAAPRRRGRAGARAHAVQILLGRETERSGYPTFHTLTNYLKLSVCFVIVEIEKRDDPERNGREI